MTDWAFNLNDIRPGLDRPSVLVVPMAVLDTLPPLTASQLADAAHGGGPSVWRRRALVALAVRALGMPPAAVRLRADGGGRRFLEGTPVFASVAYRSGVAAAAIARAPVGVDAEAINEALAAGDVALDGFDGDAAALAKWHGPAGVWAAKEAALKAGGKGLAGSPEVWRFGDAAIAADADMPMRVAHAVNGPVVAACVWRDRGTGQGRI